MSQDKPSPSVSITSHNQQGGITAHTVTIAPPARDLNSPWGEPLKQQILTALPRDKEINITSLLGDAESVELATQIHSFMQANGFKVPSGISQSVFSGPVKGLQFNPDTNTFIVGAR